MTRARVGILLLLIGTFAATARPSPAVCAPPTISVSRGVTAPGDKIVVRGRNWFDGCQDSGVCSACTGECDYGPEETALQDIEIFLQKPTGSRMRLGEVDANKKFRFEVSLDLPDDLEPGRYRIVAGSLANASIRVGGPEG